MGNNFDLIFGGKLLLMFFLALTAAVILRCFGFISPPVLASEQKLAPLTDGQLKEQIGQMIIIGFRGMSAPADSDIAKIIKDVKVGGVAFSDYDVALKKYSRNIANYAQTKQLVSDVQKMSEVPLFVAIDAEGGNVNRLNPRYGFLPVVSAAVMGRDKTYETTKREAAKLAVELKGLGFNMNFAPVLDLNINPKNPIIGAMGRSFSADKTEVASHAQAFIEVHSKNNIITAAKHFPGHGSAAADSHFGIVDVTKTYKTDELYPYRILNEGKLLDAVMVGHIMDKRIDQNDPASLSPVFLQDNLRNNIGFKGVIISDDLQMGAISANYKFDEAIIKAINAGCDVVSFLNNNAAGYDPNLAYKIRDIIFKAVKENKIEEKRITESYNRILDLKKKFKIINPGATQSQLSSSAAALQIRSQKFELLGVSDSFTFQDAVAAANYVAGKVKIRPAFLLSIFQEELSLEKYDLCYLTDFKTGNGVRAAGGQKLARVMEPKRDVPGFLKITKKLGKDPAKTLITCPMSFGWGGAMGPADFIPSTWLQYEGRIQKITGRPADPWNIEDAFLAAGLYLSDSGAASMKRDGEWKAAMIYFSGSPTSKYTWYADGALSFADKIQADIDYFYTPSASWREQK